MVSMGAVLPSRPLGAALDLRAGGTSSPLPTDAMNAHDAPPINPRIHGLPRRASHPDAARWFGRDRLLLGAATLVALLLAYQLVVTLLRPAWGEATTDWLLTLLAWPELAVVVFVAARLVRARHPSALTWCMFSAALLCSAAAWTVWTVDDQLLHYHDIPFPSLPDYLFALQYPFFFLAILFSPRTPQAGPRLLMVLDGLIFLGAAAAFSWYFLLEPLVSQGRLAPLARGVALAYPLGDLLVLAGLALIL